MENKTVQLPHLVKLHQIYLTDGDSAQFILRVSQRYTLATLHQMLQSHQPLLRQAVVHVLGMLGNEESTELLGPLLADEDRRVRMVADDAIKSLWCRLAPRPARVGLEKLLILLESGRSKPAMQTATDLIARFPQLQEAYCRRALANFNLGNIHQAILDCRQCIALAPFNYMAYVGLGQCFLELDLPWQALDSFKQSLSIYPDLETVRVQVNRLERMLREIS